MEDLRRYSNSWLRKGISFLVVSILIAISLPLIVFIPYSLLSLPPGTELSDIIILILLPGLMVTFIGIFIFVFSNLEPDIQISAQGLRVQFFWFWWLFVPWEDVEAIRAPLFGLSRSRLIIVRKLTFVHRLIGFTGGTFFKPAFLISSKLDGYNQLIRTIKDELGKL